MAVRIRAEMSGSFTDHVSGRTRVMAQAVTVGVAGGTKGFQTDMRQQLERSGVSPKVGRMIGAQVYPRNGVSLGAAGSIFARGKQAQLILDGLASADAIRPTGGRKYLAIPTAFNRAGGRKAGAARITAKEMAQLKGWTYVRPIRAGGSAGGKLWFLRVAKGEKQKRGGSVKLAFAGGRQDLLIGGGRRRRTEAALQARAVPMFILLPLVQRGRKFDPESLGAFWAGQIPDLIGRALPNE